MAVLRTLHAWAGAFLALLLVVLGLSGSLLVLRDPWVKLTTPEARMSVEASPQALGAAVQALELGGAGRGPQRRLRPRGSRRPSRLLQGQGSGLCGRRRAADPTLQASGDGRRLAVRAAPLPAGR
ncbi:PepSY domain-containing protein [Phenylobacterium sp. J426]|uniref:PepSY domain-containing protein n=1 Tax=Phenylobacterium sp. J426 TaxID=2898439 RepID=UPI0035AF42A7